MLASVLSATTFKKLCPRLSVGRDVIIGGITGVTNDFRKVCFSSTVISILPGAAHAGSRKGSISLAPQVHSGVRSHTT